MQLTSLDSKEMERSPIGPRGSASAGPLPAPPLSLWGTIVPYCQLRVPLSTFDFTLRLGARITIWQDYLGMGMAQQAMLVAACKSLDFLLGFLVAKASDSMRSPWGRRRPFIACFLPVGITCFVLFCNAGWFFERHEVDRPCANLTLHDAELTNGSSWCPALQACLETAIAEGRLFAADNTTALPNMPALAPGASAGALAVLFVLLYFGFIVGTWTSTQIPYDALGFELSDDYHERAQPRLERACGGGSEGECLECLGGARGAPFRFASRLEPTRARPQPTRTRRASSRRAVAPDRTRGHRIGHERAALGPRLSTDSLRAFNSCIRPVRSTRGWRGRGRGRGRGYGRGQARTSST